MDGGMEGGRLRPVSAKSSRIVFSLLALVSLASAQSSRPFTFRYALRVTNIPPGARLRVWIPEAQSDQFQDVKVVRATGDLALKETRESKSGNRSFYAESPKAKLAEAEFEIVYDVVRRERLTLGVARPHLQNLELSDRERKQDLAPNRLVPIDGIPADWAAKVSAGANSTLSKGRAIYDYVFATMKYDKSGSGWGRGDVLYACAAKKGNCTDFHSLFIAMARSQNIPARFSIGFQLPTDRNSGEIPGYHCWAEFFDPDHGWVPVDISEAWKHPEKKDYYFGAYDENRVQFTTGRDLELNPKQQGEPLNYFVNPYVEVDGREFPHVLATYSFDARQAVSSLDRRASPAIARTP
jgi:transglutaminase-like putative cysteine protease